MSCECPPQVNVTRPHRWLANIGSGNGLVSSMFCQEILNAKITLIQNREIIQHYTDFIMGTMASEITSLTIVYSTVFSCVDKKKYRNSASLASVRGILRWPMNSPHKWPVTQKMFPFDDVTMRYTKPGFTCPAWFVCWGKQHYFMLPKDQSIGLVVASIGLSLPTAVSALVSVGVGTAWFSSVLSCILRLTDSPSLQ